MMTYLNTELKQREDEFTEIKNIKIQIGSWNLGGVRPYESVDLAPWLHSFETNFIPDIVVIGFQEIITLSAKSIIISSNNSSHIKMWNDLVLTTLNKTTGKEYIHVAGDELVGCCISMFALKGLN